MENKEIFCAETLRLERFNRLQIKLNICQYLIKKQRLCYCSKHPMINYSKLRGTFRTR